jgi:hypothetical protein
MDEFGLRVSANSSINFRDFLSLYFLSTQPNTSLKFQTLEFFITKYKISIAYFFSTVNILLIKTISTQDEQRPINKWL